MHGPRIVQSASWLVRELSSPRVDQSANWPVRELTSPRIDQSAIRLSAIWFVRELTRKPVKLAALDGWQSIDQDVERYLAIVVSVLG